MYQAGPAEAGTYFCIRTHRTFPWSSPMRFSDPA